MKIRYEDDGPKIKVVAVLNNWKFWFVTRKGYEEAKQRYNLKDNDFIFIDYNIFNHVLLLNEKGYKTLYSCEGHRRLENEHPVIDGMYIAIIIEDNFDKYSNYLTNIPDNFEATISNLYNEDDKKVKVVLLQQQVPVQMMFEDKKYFNKLKEEDLHKLYNFIKQLPDIRKQDID